MRLGDRLQSAAAICVVALLAAIGGCERTTTAPEEVKPGVRAVVSDALHAWQQADCQEMYQTLSTADRELESLERFREKRERLHKAQELKSFRIGDIVRSGPRSFRVDVVLEIEENYNSGYRSSLEPQISETAASWAVVEDDDSYRITFVTEDSAKEN